MTALAIAGCAKELEENVTKPDEPKTEDGTMVLGAMLPDSPDADGSAQSADTKTTISDNGDKTYSVFWAEGDAISVNGKASTDIQIGENPKSAQFILPTVDAPYCAVYPAGAIVEDSFSAESDTLNITVPNTQVYIKGGFDPASAIMSAYSESADAGLTFRHTMSYIKLSITNATVKSVRINGNNNEAISGVFTVKFSKEGNSFAPRKDEKGKTKGNTSVTYSNGGSEIAANTPMFIAIPAADYQKGLTFTIVDSNNNYQVKKTSSFTAKAGGVYPSETEFKADGTYVEGGIYTAEDWNNFILDLNAGDYSKWVTKIGSATGVHLMADIDYQYNLESSSADTKVTLNDIVYGHDHTITHHPVRPMFSYIGEKGGISNLTIAGDTDTWDNSGWAGIFATNNAGKIENCINNVNLTLDKREIKTLDNGKQETIIVAAGICRTNNGSIVNCTNNGRIDIRVPANPVRIGGIIVYNDGGTISGSHNNGDISVTGVDKDCIVGGVAYAISGKGTGLENHGNIIVDANLKEARIIYIGGIAANAEYNNISTYFNSCKNSGSLTLTKTGAFRINKCAVGGIVASINRGVGGTGTSQGKDFTAFDNCSNEGDISFKETQTSDSEKSGIGYAIGGIVGRCTDASGLVYNKSGYYSVIRQGCSNSGTISVYVANGQTVSESVSGARETYIGGLAGYMSGSGATITTLSYVRGTNTGNIISGSLYGGDIVGGLVGGGANLRIHEKPTVTATISKYDSNSKNGFAGAVLGWATGTVSIENANADVTFDSSLTSVKSGFAGVTSGKTLTVKNCVYGGKSVSADDNDIYGSGTKTIQ